MTKQSRSSGWKWLVALLVLGGTGGGGWYWYKAHPKEELPEFRSATISRGDLTQAVTANGPLNAVTNVQVGSQISGIINAIKVDYNSSVKAGQIIAQIDPSTYQQNVVQAEADVASAKAALELAQVNWRRASELRKSDLIPAADADTALANLHQAEATLKTRDAALSKANVDLERTTIYAPISGVVISRNVDVGQTVAASFSTPTLFQIANDLAQMEIDAMVSEADLGGVEEGQKVTFTVDAFPTRQFEGRVRQVRYAPVTNQNVVNYTTVVDVNNPDLKLRPGMTAYASIITAQRSTVLKVPNSAIQQLRIPEAALIKPPTNAAPGVKVLATAGAPGLAQAAAGQAAVGQAGSGPPGGGDARPNREEMRRRFENMTPEERAAFRERMRARFGDGGPPGGFGGGGPGAGRDPARARPEGPVIRTAYLLVKERGSDGKEHQLAKPVTVKTGITDGSFTEVLDGLKEGDVVITGVVVTTASDAASRMQPGSPFGGPMRFRPR